MIAFWKVSRERTYERRIRGSVPLFITRDTWTQVRGCKVLKQQSSRESMAFGTYCGTSPLFAGTVASISSSLYSNSHPFNPFNSRRSQAWHLDPWPLSLRIGSNGYIAICTVATINLPPSITALERDSPIYERLLPLRPRMLHAWIVSARLFPLCRAREFIRPGWILPRASCKIQLSGD